jgi:DNA-binding IclR family transcriptional regulator
VTSKALSLLDAFTAARPVLSLNQLAEITGLPLSTAHRLASELVAWGGLERAGTVGYRIGLRLWEIGSLAPRGEGLRSAALPMMQNLYQATLANVHLAVLDGTQALYIEKINGPNALRVQSRRGGRLPLHATGVGKVLLAFGPDRLVEDVIAAGLTRYTARTIVTPGRLHRNLTQVRETRLAYAYEELTVGSLTVAAPIVGPDESVVAALDVVLHTTRSDARRLGPAVRTAAISISRALRAAPDVGPPPRRR